MGRIQAFEFNDEAWAPAPLRDVIVEALSRTLAWGGMLRGLVGPFSDFVKASGATEVLDLCAGAGGPAEILATEMKRAGVAPPKFVLTDLYPRVEAWEAARAAHPDVVTFEASPVDATKIAPELGRGRARAIVNAFHHFPPDVAQALLADAALGSEGVFVSECFGRNPAGFLNFVPFGLPALLVAPALSRRDHVAKALVTWATPMAVLASAWDGFVSTLRVYTEAELFAMVAPLGDCFRWEFRTYPVPPFGRGTCFFGVPRR